MQALKTPIIPSQSSFDEESCHHHNGEDEHRKSENGDSYRQPSCQWKVQSNSRNDGMHHSSCDRIMGVHGIIRAYNGIRLFGGNWDENLTNYLKFLDTLAYMCNLTPQEKLAGMLVMLSGNVLDFYAERADDCTSYEEAKNVLHNWYNNPDNNSRIVTEWQRLRLLKEKNLVERDGNRGFYEICLQASQFSDASKRGIATQHILAIRTSDRDLHPKAAGLLSGSNSPHGTSIHSTHHPQIER